MKHILCLVSAVLLCAATAHAAWYWPFGSDEDSPDRPPRLHRLLENANDLIEQAEDASLDGDAEKALELYNAALTNLVDIANQNPERAEKPEFAPLRNKIAATSAAIDSIRFAQVNQNIRAVAVTDTTELQKRYDAEQAKKKGLDKVLEKKEEPEAKKDDVPTKEPVEESVKKPAEPAPAESPPAAPPKPSAAPKSVLAPASEPAPATIAVFDEKIQLAIKELKAKDYAAADLLLEELEKERKGDLNVLILRAAAQNGMRYHLAARRTLEKAMRAHPRNYLPYYNLAYLMFKLEDEGVESARQYYELGRALGGPVDARIESLLK